MAFWLAKERRGQDSDWIQRFDPRFWTVNFPRPMMASVVTTGPDSLRVECEFHHAGELAGLIWASEDLLDHPLTAYATDRDYARTTLYFPLAIVGGDRARRGKRSDADDRRPRRLGCAAHLVRAVVELCHRHARGRAGRIAVLGARKRVRAARRSRCDPADIDRMFISIVPPGYAPESTDAVARACRRLGRAVRRSPATASVRCSRSATCSCPARGGHGDRL